jgi:hypothetical protein
MPMEPEPQRDAPFPAPTAPVPMFNNKNYKKMFENGTNSRSFVTFPSQKF